MFDLVIKNGLLCDGTGKPSFQADIGIAGDKIIKIGKIREEEGVRVIDAAGKTVTPGFIDPHTHADLSILACPEAEPYLKQGVTTLVTGNCGYGMAPQGKDTFYCMDFDQEFLDLAGADRNDPLPLIFDRNKAAKALKERYSIDLDWDDFDGFNKKCDGLPLGCNLVPLLGYSAARTAVMGKDCMRSANEEELKGLEQVVRDSMEAGAFGISTGRDPVYLPGPFADDGETRRMLKIVAEYGGIFSSHTHNRDEQGNPDRLGGYEEMIRQAEGTGVKLNISHVHVLNMADTPEEAAKAAKDTLKYFEEVQRVGTDLSWDVIPSATCADFTQTSFGYYLKPLVLLAGGRRQLAEKFTDEAFMIEVHKMLAAGKLPSLDETSDSCMLFELCILKHKNPDYAGKYLEECAEELDLGLFDTAAKLFAEDPDMAADAVAPDFQKSVDILCASDYAMPCSDGDSHAKETNLTGNEQIPLHVNSMNISYIPAYLTGWGKDNFERAVRQASGFPAERFNIEKRGIIKEGNFADLVILDRKRLRSFDREENPLQDPCGIEYVVVNGCVALEEGTLTEAASGRVLRKGKQQ